MLLFNFIFTLFYNFRFEFKNSVFDCAISQATLYDPAHSTAASNAGSTHHTNNSAKKMIRKTPSES